MDYVDFIIAVKILTAKANQIEYATIIQMNIIHNMEIARFILKRIPWHVVEK